MTVNVVVAGVSYPVPSAASDVNWAADQLAFEQALAAAATVSRKSVNVTPVGTGADTTEDPLMTYQLLAGTLASNGMGVRVTAWGDGVNTVDVTTLRAYFGVTKVVEQNLQPLQANTWRVVFEVFRASASTQVATSLLVNSQTVVANTAPAENLNNNLIIGFTGQRDSTSTANSVRQLGMFVELIS